MKSRLFLVCLLVRFALAFVIQYAPTHLGWFPLGIIPLYIGFGFICRMLNVFAGHDPYNYSYALRYAEEHYGPDYEPGCCFPDYEPGVLGFFRGPINDRGCFGGRVWWASYRLLHASLYIAVAFCISPAFYAPHIAAVILGVDVGFAAIFGFWEWLNPSVRTARPSPLPTSAP